MHVTEKIRMMNRCRGSPEGNPSLFSSFAPHDAHCTAMRVLHYHFILALAIASVAVVACGYRPISGTSSKSQIERC
ncbi:hypothetical protein [Pandoravirus japonicus]|uniref:Uncharacterized protein n=1 Tax=Pandoravirus japonicus TaxID=2823154 RepID=A0A811BLY4_9VIRU|nr:hypothetical protein [Pandoravirus japonicus]